METSTRLEITLREVEGFFFVILAALATAWLVGCAHSQPKSQVPLASLFIQLSGKTAVFCLQGNKEERHRIEMMTVEQMKKQGFEATEGSPQVPNVTSYSPLDIASLLQRAGYKSVAETTYDGDVPKEGLAKHLQVKLRTLSTRKDSSASKVKTDRDTALANLMLASLQFGTQQITP